MPAKTRTFFYSISLLLLFRHSRPINPIMILRMVMNIMIWL